MRFLPQAHHIYYKEKNCLRAGSHANHNVAIMGDSVKQIMMNVIQHTVYSKAINRSNGDGIATDPSCVAYVHITPYGEYIPAGAGQTILLKKFL